MIAVWCARRVYAPEVELAGVLSERRGCVKRSSKDIGSSHTSSTSAIIYKIRWLLNLSEILTRVLLVHALTVMIVVQREGASSMRCSWSWTRAKTYIKMMSRTWCDNAWVNTRHQKVMIIIIVGLCKIRVIIVCTVNHWVLNTYWSCCSHLVRIYARARRYVSMIVLISIDFIVVFWNDLVELVGVKLF